MYGHLVSTIRRTQTALNRRVRQTIEQDPRGWLAIGLVAVLLFVGIVIALFRMDAGDAPEPPPPTPTEVAIQVTPTPTIATPPTAEATVVPEEETPEPIAADCDAGCLVRVPATDEVADLLAAAAERPSWENDDWLWAIVRTPTIEALEAEATEVVLVQDSPETLYLYASTLR